MDVGKISLQLVYTTKKFPTYYVCTRFDTYEANIDTWKGEVRLRLCSTPASLDYVDRHRLQAYENVSVIMLCYAVDCRDSFNRIDQHWVPEINHYALNVPLVLVACKTDLRETHVDRTQFVSRKEGLKQARRIGAKFIETSALEHKNVKKAFDLALLAALVPHRKVRDPCVIA